jgi:hypothetical protein
MQASIISSAGKPQAELFQIHSLPKWKRYESEEEDVSEAGSSNLPSPTEHEGSEAGVFDDADEIAEDENGITESNYGLLSPHSEFFRFQNGLAAPITRPVSIATESTAKRSSAATCVPDTHHLDEHRDNLLDQNSTLEEIESSADDNALILLPRVCYVPSARSTTDTDPDSHTAMEDSLLSEGAVDEDEEVLEAQQIAYIAPTSRPSIISIQTPTTEFPLTSEEDSNVADRMPRENNRKRASTSSDMGPADRSKRYSAMFFRDPFAADEKPVYASQYGDPRACFAQRDRRSPSRNDILQSIAPDSDVDAVVPRRTRSRSRSVKSVFIPRAEPPLMPGAMLITAHSARSISLQWGVSSTRPEPEFRSSSPRRTDTSQPRSIRSSSYTSDNTVSSSPPRTTSTQNSSLTSFPNSSTSSLAAPSSQAPKSHVSPASHQAARLYSVFPSNTALYRTRTESVTSDTSSIVSERGTKKSPTSYHLVGKPSHTRRDNAARANSSFLSSLATSTSNTNNTMRPEETNGSEWSNQPLSKSKSSSMKTLMGGFRLGRKK